MKTLYEEIQRHGGKSAPCLIKHLRAAGIEGWGALTKANLFALRDELREAVAPNSAKFYLAALRSIIGRFEDEITLPKDWRNIFQSKAEKPVKTFLTPKEIEAFASVRPRNKRDRFVQAAFLCGCWTGARVSDIMDFSELNIQNGVLTYVSKKTSTRATIPAKPCVWGYIETVQSYEGDVCLMTYNRIVRELARRAGISKEVKIYKAGESKTVKKWEALSSHSARISFCTNLAAAGCSLNDVAKLAGHSSPSMTQRYVCDYEVNLPAKAMAYFS